MNNPFFKNYGPFKLSDILISITDDKNDFDENFSNNFLIHDIKNLTEASSNDVTFFHSLKALPTALKQRLRILT